MPSFHLCVRAGLLAAVILTVPAHADFAAKEKEIVEASQATLTRLVKLRDSSNLSPENTLKVIQEEISPSFDFKLLAQSMLGKYWSKATDHQQAEVCELFQKLLEKTYAVSLAKFSNQSFTHRPSKARGNKGTVAMSVASKGKTVRIDYLLTESDGVWNITDMRIEKVSLLGNYRRQFASIVRKDGIDKLINLLRSKS